MGHSRLDEISAFLATHWKDTLEKNGFFPTQDSVEWVRLTDGRVMQIILCSALRHRKFSFTRRPCPSICGAIIAAR